MMAANRSQKGFECTIPCKTVLGTTSAAIETKNALAKKQLAKVAPVDGDNLEKGAVDNQVRRFSEHVIQARRRSAVTVVLENAVAAIVAAHAQAHQALAGCTLTTSALNLSNNMIGNGLLAMPFVFREASIPMGLVVIAIAASFSVAFP